MSGIHFFEFKKPIFPEMQGRIESIISPHYWKSLHCPPGSGRRRRRGRPAAAGVADGRPSAASLQRKKPHASQGPANAEIQALTQVQGFDMSGQTVNVFLLRAEFVVLSLFTSPQVIQKSKQSHALAVWTLPISARHGPCRFFKNEENKHDIQLEAVLVAY